MVADDCEGCGIAGAAPQTDVIRSYRPGVTAEGLDAVELHVWAEGTCADSDELCVVFDPAGLVIRRPATAEVLDTAAVTYDGSTHAYPDGRSVAADWTELGRELVLGVGADTVTCVPGVGATVDCTAM